MATRNFRLLVAAMPPARQQKIEKRFQASLVSMPLAEIRRAREMTQLRLGEALGVHQSEVSKIGECTCDAPPVPELPKCRQALFIQHARACGVALFPRCISLVIEGPGDACPVP